MEMNETENNNNSVLAEDEACRSKLVGEILEIIGFLLHKLLKEKPVVSLVKMERGSNIFIYSDQKAYWSLCEKLLQVRTEAKHQKLNSLTVVLSLREREKISSVAGELGTYPSTNAVMKELNGSAFWIDLEAFDDNMITDYIALELGVGRSKVPIDLVNYVSGITSGNPLFIREALVNMKASSHITVSGESLNIVADLDNSVEVSSWPNTYMVGGVLGILESLDPLPASIVKMSTVFQGEFRISDLLVSACSPWSGGARFEALKLFYALNQLVDMGILELDGQDLEELTKEELHKKKLLGPYRLNNVLVRKVAGAMVLEAQRKSIKRQALMDRCLAKDLPERMDQVRRKKLIPHIPWYYQIELPQNNRRAGDVGPEARGAAARVSTLPTGLTGIK